MTHVMGMALLTILVIITIIIDVVVAFIFQLGAFNIK